MPPSANATKTSITILTTANCPKTEGANILTRNASCTIVNTRLTNVASVVHEVALTNLLNVNNSFYQLLALCFPPASFKISESETKKIDVITPNTEILSLNDALLVRKTMRVRFT